LLDEVAAGDELQLTLPAGVFTLRPHDTPIVALCGGSGVTPVFSIVKHALAVTDRRVRVLYANLDARSVIFRAELDALAEQHGDRLDVVHHLDTESGFVYAGAVKAFTGPDLDADFYICGPAPFMDVVEDALAELGVPDDHVFVERFAFAAAAAARPPGPAAATTDDVTAGTEAVVIVLDGKAHEVKYHDGETFLETARRAGLRPPFSCEAGSCATCMAFLRDGEARMRVNNALTPEEVEEGWVLTCQGLPLSSTATVVYEH
jgi:ferredoxin-NADP reductase